MWGPRLALALVVLVAASCAPVASPVATLPSALVPSPATLTAPPEPSLTPTLPSPGSSVWCAGRTWPPYRMASLDGITITIPQWGNARLEITNHSRATVYYRIATWTIEQLEGCVGFVENESERGPVPAGETVSTSERLVSPAGGSVTVAFWITRCGEDCTSEPVSAVLVQIPAYQPISS